MAESSAAESSAAAARVAAAVPHTAASHAPRAPESSRGGTRITLREDAPARAIRQARIVDRVAGAQSPLVALSRTHRIRHGATWVE